MSFMNKFRVWLRNPRNFVVLGGSSAVVVTLVKACPLLFPSQLYRPVMEAYKSGQKVKLGESQIQEFEDVCRDLEVETKPFHLFVTSRWDLKVKGLQFFPSGVHFGIPVLFVDKPELQNSKFAAKLKVNMDSEEGKAFKDSIQLSQKARKFALAKEVIYSKKHYAAYPLLLAPGAVIGGFVSTFALQVTASIFPLYITGFLVGSVFYVTYRYLLGVLNERHDLKTDDIVAQLGENYAEGGLEFYEKTLQRNKALRKLLGSKGEALYTYYGNDTPGVLWTKGAPITVKRAKFQNIVQNTSAGDSPTSDKTL